MDIRDPAGTSTHTQWTSLPGRTKIVLTDVVADVVADDTDRETSEI